MKKCLYALLILKIIAAALQFFMLLSTSILYAIISTVIAVLDIVLVIAVIGNIGEIEELWYDLNRMRYDIKVLNDATEKVCEVNHIPSVDSREAARGAWECVKCGTVNKQGTSICSNCSADYSAWTNPTDNPHKKKKLSRWIK